MKPFDIDKAKAGEIVILKNFKAETWFYVGHLKDNKRVIIIESALSGEIRKTYPESVLSKVTPQQVSKQVSRPIRRNSKEK